MNRKGRVHLTCGISTALCALGCAALAAGAPPQPDGVLIAGSWSGYHVHRDVAAAFSRQTGIRTGVLGRRNDRGFEHLAAGRMDVLVFSPQPSLEADALIKKHFPAGGLRPVMQPFGQFVVRVIVNRANVVRRLSVPQLRSILLGDAANWSDVTGVAEARAEIAVFGERDGAKSREIVANVVLGGRGVPSRVRTMPSVLAVIAAVAKDRNAIGIMLDGPGAHANRAGVKSVAIGATGEGPFHAPTDESVYEGRYLLHEPLVLYARAGASPAARAYCEFAVGPQAAEIARKRSLYTEYDRQQYAAANRMREFRAGRGPEVTVAGLHLHRQLLRDLNEAFVTAEDVVRASYGAATTDVPAVGAFALGQAELLLLNDEPSEASLKIHGKKWRELWRDLRQAASSRRAQADRGGGASSSCSGGPPYIVLGGRAVAVCAHALNPLDSLTVMQVSDIFGKEGKGRAWNAYADLDGEIHCYGVAGGRTASRLFYNKGVSPYASGPVVRKADTAAVLEALALDPQGIAFADAGHVPAGNPSIKVLAIGDGETRPILPTAKTVLSGEYLLSETLRMYVSPKASRAAKSFARFLEAGGADTALRDHGFLLSRRSGRNSAR